MKIGTHFKSKSKIQNEYIGYTYTEITKSGRHYLKADSGDVRDDCEVDVEWFNNRHIIID